MSVAAPPESPPSPTASPDAHPSGPPRRRRHLPEWLKGNLLLLPTSIWFIFLLVIPMLIVIEYSLGKRGIVDPVRFTWNSLHYSNYKDALDPDRLPIFVRSIEYAGISTLACVALGFPLAYWIARFGGKLRNIYLVLVIIPFLTSYLIRIYAWQVILQNNGLLNRLLGDIGLGRDHVFLNHHFAVILGLTYGFLPFMILPLYASIERMDFALVEASYDLGHAKVSTFFRVILPTVAPGLVAGILLVFIPAVGDFVTPQLLGGVRTQMIGNTIADQFGGSQNWPLGSAMSVLLMLFILGGVFVYLRRVGEDAL
ncbi:MAG: spermidine/putrescine transport system permease protein [Actinomycetota bacterium]|nr:spermidine/putrescine transport system permease protein [Actinomycetota bacterium]